MPSPRILLMIGSILTLLLILNSSLNNEMPKPAIQVAENKDQKIQNVSPLNIRKDDVVSALRGEIQTLKAEMSRLKLQIINSHNDLMILIESQQLGEYQISEFNIDQELMPEILEQGAEQVEQQLSSMETIMTEEPVDSEWSSATTDQLQMAFDSSELNGADIVDLECRKTLCRIEMNIDNPLLAAEYQLWLSAKIGDILPQASMTISQDEAGNPSAILFLAREGYNLPAAE